jgi:hypothetical protein
LRVFAQEDALRVFGAKEKKCSILHSKFEISFENRTGPPPEPFWICYWEEVMQSNYPTRGVLAWSKNTYMRLKENPVISF